MKRFFKVLLIVILLMVIIAPTAMAADDEYEIAEIKMKVTAPTGWLAFTRDSSDEDFAQINLTRDQIITQYKQFGIFLNALQLDPLAEVLVIMLEDNDVKKIFDMKSLSDKKIDDIAQGIMNADIDELLADFEEERSVDVGDIEDAKYSDYYIYKTEQADYIVMGLSQKYNGVEVFTTQYYTIINGQAINVVLKNYIGEVTDEQNDILRKMVDSIEFTEIKEKPKGFLPDFTNLVTLFQFGIGIVLIFGVVRFLMTLNKEKKKSKVKRDLKDE